jgi:hypothetical protein
MEDHKLGRPPFSFQLLTDIRWRLDRPGQLLGRLRVLEGCGALAL